MTTWGKCFAMKTERSVRSDRFPGGPCAANSAKSFLFEEHRQHVHCVFARIKDGDHRYVIPGRVWHGWILAYLRPRPPWPRTERPMAHSSHARGAQLKANAADLEERGT